MIWNRVRGHRAQVDMFQRALQRQRLAHAYLFVGPHGIGKRLFAQTLAQCFFCEQVDSEKLAACGACAGCKQVAAGSHPDLLQVGCPEGKKELPIDLLVGAKERRGKEGLCHDLALRPMTADRRIAIIADAELMNEASANALLKTLEEPPAGSILFLLTRDTEPILPTIRSRCQPVRFSPLNVEDVAALLSEQEPDLSADRCNSVAAMSRGSLEVARQLLDPGMDELRQLVARCLGGEIDPLKSPALILESLDSLGGDTAAQRQNMRWVIQFAVQSLQESLAAVPTPGEADRQAALLDRCLDSVLHLNQTMPVALCLEALFADLARLSREPNMAG